MKKGWLFAAAALLLAGIAICVASMATLGFRFSALSTEAYETNTYSVEGKIKRISIDAETDKITLLPAKDGKCKVVCSETKKITHEVTEKNGELSIRTEDKRTWVDQIGLHLGTPKIAVYLPAGAYDQIAIETDTGDIDIPAEFSFAALQIHGDTSDVDCRADVSGAMEIALSTGDITLAELDAGSLTLSVSTGIVTVDSVNCKGGVDIHLSTGKTRLNGLQCASLRTDGSTGDITLQDVVASGTFTIERSTGDVRFENSDASEIYVTTSTGEVTGSLRSEKVFITRSDTGRQDVPKSVTGGRCEITTDTGDIEITVPYRKKNGARRGSVLFSQSMISTVTFSPVRCATDLMIVRISLAIRPWRPITLPMSSGATRSSSTVTSPGISVTVTASGCSTRFLAI